MVREKYYNKTNTCGRCVKKNMVTDSSILRPGNAYHELDNRDCWTGGWLCKLCWYHEDYRERQNGVAYLKRQLAHCRTGDQDPNSVQAKADMSQELACGLYEWIDINKENDNHKSPLDCYDPKTELCHQVQMRHYNSLERYWNFNWFERELEKNFEDVVCFCMSKDGKIVERIYKFPKEKIDERAGTTIAKYPTGRWSVIPWYEKYRVEDKDELKKANDIWNRIKK